MEDSNASLFEYSTFKIPYEEINQKFRIGSKNIDRVGTHLCKTTSALRNEVNAGPTPERASKLFEDVEKRVQEFRQAIKRSIDDQRELLTTIKRRAEHLSEEEVKSDSALKEWHRKLNRTNRLTIIYLLKCGRIETAKKFASKAKLEHMVDVAIFEEGRKIEAALSARDTEPCLKWITEHRSRLRKLTTNLEQMVRVQDIIELIRSQRRSEAYAYVKKFLVAVQKDENCSEDVRKVQALLFTGTNTTHKPYLALLEDSRWAVLSGVFHDAFWELYALPFHSAFSTNLQCGISAHKTLVCTPGGHESCVACQPIIHELGEGLPRAHIGQSRLYCAYSGEELNEDNPPYILPTGYVYGEKTLDRLGTNIRCCKTDGTFLREQCVRLFIL